MVRIILLVSSESGMVFQSHLLQHLSFQGMFFCLHWCLYLTDFSNFFDVISASKQFAEEVLKAHNDYRKKHGVPPLKLCKKLNRGAQQWVQSFLFSDKISVTFIDQIWLCTLQKYFSFWHAAIQWGPTGWKVMHSTLFVFLPNSSLPFFLHQTAPPNHMCTSLVTTV